MLEHFAEMIRAEANKPRQGGDRQPLRKMFLDVGRDNLLRPFGESTSDLRFDAWYPAIETHEFIHEQDPKGLKIGPIY